MEYVKLPELLEVGGVKLKEASAIVFEGIVNADRINAFVVVFDINR